MSRVDARRLQAKPRGFHGDHLRGLSGGDYSTVEDDGDAIYQMEAVREEILPPRHFSCTGTDSCVFQVVVDEVLTDQEQEEWVREGWSPSFKSRMRAACGARRRTGRASGVRIWREPSHFLDIPAGDYQAGMYTYLNGVNGEGSCLGDPRARKASA